jgi:hypothetical protein
MPAQMGIDALALRHLVRGSRGAVTLDNLADPTSAASAFSPPGQQQPEKRLRD